MWEGYSYIQNSPAATIGKVYYLYAEQFGCHYGKGIFFTFRTVWLPLCKRDILVRVAAVGFSICIGQNPCQFCFKQCNLWLYGLTKIHHHDLFTRYVQLIQHKSPLSGHGLNYFFLRLLNNCRPASMLSRSWPKICNTNLMTSPTQLQMTTMMTMTWHHLLGNNLVGKRMIWTLIRVLRKQRQRRSRVLVDGF